MDKLGLELKARRKFTIVAIIVIAAMALVIPAVQVYRDWAFVDRNSGSRTGYRDWALGWRTGSWHRESAIETFMRSEYPTEFQQDWVSYAGTGRNIFGDAILAGHGRPGPIVLLKPEAIDRYCQTASRTEKRRFHDVFASGDSAKIQELVDQISEASMTSGTTEPDSAASRSQPIHGEPNRKSVAADSDR